MPKMLEQPNGQIDSNAHEEATKTRKELVRELLGKIEKGFNVDKTKVTLADYIRLTQLERELEEEEQPREIIITWSEPPEKQSIGE